MLASSLLAGSLLALAPVGGPSTGAVAGAAPATDLRASATSASMIASTNPSTNRSTNGGASATTSGSRTFDFTGAPVGWTVPADVGCLWVTAWGGSGGTGGSYGTSAVGGPGGAGAAISGAVAVTPGSTVTLMVGGAGGSGARGVAPGSGGPGNGADGGTGGASTNSSGASGGGGGAASWLAQPTLLLVAGGGGGGGAGGITGASGGAGGAGGVSGRDGGAGSPQTAAGTSYVGTGGRGATPTTAGAAGGLTFGSADAGVVPPTSGQGATGGTGGTGWFGGGGGGGGVLGGGGGYPAAPANGAGGGGGSSLVPPGGASGTAPSGNGRIVVGWNTADPTCTGPAQPIAFVSDRDGNDEIYVTDADGSNPTRLTTSPSRDEAPAWSPDGTRIAFVSDRDGNDEIYVMGADGSNPTRLTNDPGSDQAPAWSPDGTRIAFTSGRDGAALGYPGEHEVFVMRADGSTPTRITSELPRARTPSWSPDGGLLAYEASGNVVTAAVDGSHRSQIGAGSRPRWSPDGTRIAFDYADPAAAALEEVYWMNADGSSRTRLTTSPDKNDRHPSWGPGGTALVFASDFSGSFELYVSNLAGTNTRITTNAAADIDPDWWRPNTVPVTADLHGWYAPIVPARVLDSRPESQVGPYATRWGPAETRDVQVTGVGGVPADAEAVVLNVTGVLPNAATYLTLWPAGETLPLVSNLNLDAGQVAANLATVRLGAGGKVSLYNSAGRTDVVADVVGYYAPGPTGGRYTAVAPTRVLDSRAESQVGPFSTAWAPGESRRLTVVGGDAAVPTDALAVVLNVTGVLPSQATHLTVWPTGTTMPTASNLNLPGADVRANLVVVKVGTEGRISIANNSGFTDVVADLVGWYAPGPTGARFNAVTPRRVLDSRPESQVGSYATPWGPGEARGAGAAGPDGTGIPTTVTGVVLNVTGVVPTAATHLTVWPFGTPMPVASNLNLPAGSVRPNLVIVGGGSVSIRNNSGQTHVVADLVGWFGP